MLFTRDISVCRLPSYSSSVSGEESQTSLQGWLRYWVVVSCAAIPDILLATLQVPHHTKLRTVFICWCLCPGPLSGTELIFNQVWRSRDVSTETSNSTLSRYFQCSLCCTRLAWQLSISPSL